MKLEGGRQFSVLINTKGTLKIILQAALTALLHAVHLNCMNDTWCTLLQLSSNIYIIPAVDRIELRMLSRTAVQKIVSASPSKGRIGNNNNKIRV